MTARSLRALGLALAGAVLLHAAMAAAAGIEVENAWARATPPAAPTGAAYFTLHNTGAAADRLVEASSPVAERAELHTHFMDRGVARMEAIDAVALPPGEAVAFAPGGLHVMLFGLKAPLQPGASFPIVLVFERAGRVPVTVAVRHPRDGAPGAERPGGAGGNMPGGVPMPGGGHKH